MAGDEGEKTKKGVDFAWLFLSLENFSEVLRGWDNTVFLGVIGFDIFLKCKLLRQIFLGITNADLPAAVLIQGPG